jgi:hypothetical protein
MYVQNFRDFSPAVEEIYALQVEKMKFRNAWPRPYSSIVFVISTVFKTPSK